LDDYLRWVELDANNPEKVIVEGRLYDGIRKRIEETAKYIAPKFGTMDFAFMYIPSEPLFFDILDRKILKKGANVTNLIEWAARERKVHLVSPTTLLTYLQSIMQGLKAVQIEQHADEIRKKLSKLFDYLKRHYDEIIALGKSLTAAQNHYDKVEKSLSQVGTTVNQITGQTTALDDDETTIAEIIPDESESNSPNAHLS
jgi:DNA recombination protein RmuC